MKKFIAMASVIFYCSFSSFAESATIFNNNKNDNQIIVYYRECGRPIADDHLDCLPEIYSIDVRSGASAFINVDPGYFINLMHVIEEDSAGQVQAEARYGSFDRCELFDNVFLQDNGMGGITCLY